MTNAIEHLTSEDGYALQPGDTIYTAHQGANGTFLKLYVIRNHSTTNEPYIANITWYAAHALGMKPRNRNGEWVIHNPVYGMDRGFDLVYGLASILFRDMTEEERREASPYAGSTDAGYLLNHKWL